LCSLNEQAPKPTTDDLYTVNMCIINAPAVDAVPVVRCKCCKHCHILSDGHSFRCYSWDMDLYAPQYDAATFYCADGERRESE